jgi:hypothetical protein
MRLAWDLDTKITRFSCHRKVAQPMQEIFEEVLHVYGRQGIRDLGLDLFGGCLNVRKIRGGRSWSTHSWGISVDLDPARNRLRWGRDRAEFAKPAYNDFWRAVEKRGAVSLGKERNFDWMHFQFSRLR